MKRILTLIFLSIIFLSCKKENPVIKTLKGTWELSSSNSGFANIVTNYPSGNGFIIKYTSNKYQRFSKGQLVESGTYNIKKDSIRIFGELGDKIIYNHQDEIFFTVDETHLSFFMDANDGGGVTYSRVGN